MIHVTDYTVCITCAESIAGLDAYSFGDIDEQRATDAGIRRILGEHGDGATWHESIDKTHDFDTQPCECCQSRMAGERYTATVGEPLAPEIVARAVLALAMRGYHATNGARNRQHADRLSRLSVANDGYVMADTWAAEYGPAGMRHTMVVQVAQHVRNLCAAMRLRALNARDRKAQR